MVEGLTLRPNVHYVFGEAIFKKRSNAQNTSSAGASLLQIARSFENSTWYSSAGRNIRTDGGVFDSNNKTSAFPFAYLSNAQDCEFNDITVIHNDATASASWGIFLAGRNIKLRNPTVLKGAQLYQDGLHIGFGQNISVYGGYLEAGDDAIAIGTDSVFGDEWDDQITENISVIGTVVRANKGSGIKVYYPAAPTAGTFRHRIRNVNVQVVGAAGIVRNNFVAVIDSYVSAAAGPVDQARIQGVNISVNGTALSSTHDGTNPYGVYLDSVSDVTVTGSLTLPETIPAQSGLQILRFATKNSSALSYTGSLVDATTYTASVLLNGVSNINLSLTGAQIRNTYGTFGLFMTWLQGQVASFGTAEFWTNDLTIKSNTTGASSAVAITTGTLFPIIAGYQSANAALPGNTTQPTGVLMVETKNCRVNVNFPAMPAGGLATISARGAACIDNTLENMASVAGANLTTLGGVIALANAKRTRLSNLKISNLPSNTSFLKPLPGSASSVEIASCVASKASGATNTYAISNNTGRIAQYYVHNNDFSGLDFAVEPTNFPASEAAYIFSENVGCVTKKRGTVTVSVGSNTTANVNMGTAFRRPDATTAWLPMVKLWPLTTFGGATKWWLEAGSGPNNFTVKTDSNVTGADAIFAFEADVGQKPL